MRRSLAAATLLAPFVAAADPTMAQLCRQKLAESALIGVRLNDPGSAERVLGRDFRAAAVPEEDMDRYLSADGRQEVRFIITAATNRPSTRRSSFYLRPKRRPARRRLRPAASRPNAACGWA